MGTIFIGFATGPFLVWGYLISFFAYHLCRFKYVMLYDARSVHNSVDTRGRGAGYWRWKPIIIIRTLQKFPDGIIVYSDMGRSFRYLPFVSSLSIQKFLEKHKIEFIPGIFVPEHGPNKKWTKKFTFEKLNITDNNFFLSPQLQATWSIWTHTKSALLFLNEWNELCSDLSLIDDTFNSGIDKCFIDHRHDQSLLTIQFLRRNPRYLFDQNKIFHFNKSFTIVFLQIKSPVYEKVFLLLEVIRRRLSNFKQWIKKIN
jgi:hypothetical protein